MLQASRAKDGNSNVPSKVFKFIDRKYSTDYFEYPNVSVNGQTEQTAPSSNLFVIVIAHEKLFLFNF